MEFLSGLLVVLGLTLLWRLWAGALDKERIRLYVEERGGAITDIRWRLFGPGWLGAGKNRIYSVAYNDADGRKHEGHCKTSALGGVYWHDGDQPSPLVSSNGDSCENLQAENERLKQEIERLRRGAN